MPMGSRVISPSSTLYSSMRTGSSPSSSIALLLYSCVAGDGMNELQKLPIWEVCRSRPPRLRRNSSRQAPKLLRGPPHFHLAKWMRMPFNASMCITDHA
ncbi:hypothetical protein GY45DRAFT_927440 [Cubamyces sp. BRFM 1775]|nr:hypothetical protein GY45DRAFT_927440 [Cubamyces sp. BRFM 1775]